MAAAAAQQAQAQQQATSATSNPSSASSSASNYHGYPTSVNTSNAVDSNAMAQMANQMFGAAAGGINNSTDALSQLNFFQRSFQRNFTDQMMPGLGSGGRGIGNGGTGNGGGGSGSRGGNGSMMERVG